MQVDSRQQACFEHHECSGRQYRHMCKQTGVPHPDDVHVLSEMTCVWLTYTELQDVHDLAYPNPRAT